MPIIAEQAADAGPTLDEIVTEIIAQAQGFAIAPDRVLALTADLPADALTFQVSDRGSPGVFEIGDELVYVTSFDDSSSTATVHPRGRGWLGTVATDHTAGDIVIGAPALPRKRCAEMVNGVVAGLFPTVYGIGTTEVELPSGGVVELPDDAEFILGVRYLCEGEWETARHWEAARSRSDSLTGNLVTVRGVTTGSTVQVIFGVRPEPFATGTQAWSNTGLPLSLKDVVVLGVLARFAQNLDLGRLTDRFVSPSGDAQQPQLGAGFAMARQLRADFQVALDREAANLRNLYPAPVHFTR